MSVEPTVADVAIVGYGPDGPVPGALFVEVMGLADGVAAEPAETASAGR